LLNERIRALAESSQMEAKAAQTPSDFYKATVDKLSAHVNAIGNKVNEVLERAGSNALDEAHKLSSSVDALRRLDAELEVRTAATHYRTIESINALLRQLKRDAEELLARLDVDSNARCDYDKLGKQLTRLANNSEWLERIAPGSYSAIVSHICDELSDYLNKIENDLSALETNESRSALTSHLCKAHKLISDKLEPMKAIDKCVPVELSNKRLNMVRRFEDRIEKRLNDMKSKFDLSERSVEKVREQLVEMLRVKKGLDEMHPCKRLLERNNYDSIRSLIKEIENENKDIQQEQDELKVEKEKLEKGRQELEKIRHKTIGLSSTKQKMLLQDNGFKGRGGVDERMEEFNTIEKQLDAKEKRLNEMIKCVAELESLRDEYNDLLNKHNLDTEQEQAYLKQHNWSNAKALQEAIGTTRQLCDEFDNRQAFAHFFSSKLDLTAASNALEFIEQCERLNWSSTLGEKVKEISTTVRNYMSEYGQFLSNECIEKLRRIVDENSNSLSCSRDLEFRLKELHMMSKNERVYASIGGCEVAERWRVELSSVYTSLCKQVDELRNAGNYSELNGKLRTAQILSQLDRNMCAELTQGTQILLFLFYFLK
jgi:DNA repair exonuclease SbcCD ATPase subunit